MFGRYRVEIMKNVWVNILVPSITKRLLLVRDFPTLPATKTKYFIRMEVIYGVIELYLKMIGF